MRLLEAHELREIVPRAGDLIASFLDPLNNACMLFDITSARRQAVFIAHTAHESSSFRKLSENLNYSADRLLAMWPKRFTPETAAACGRQPERIANIVYASRMGNGDEASGEGWMYRGRGLIQLTGKDNYRMCGTALDQDLLENPDLLLDPLYAARSAGWFFRMKGINALADKGDFEATCLRVNGALTGMEERIAFYEQALKVLA